MREILFFVLIFVSVIGAYGQQGAKPTPIPAQTPVVQKAIDLADYGVRIEPDKRLIVVTAALEIGGMSAPILSKEGEAFRARLKTDLVGTDPSLVQKMQGFLKTYRERHSKARPEELMAPFVSLAYAMGPVPDLTEPQRSADLPHDLLEVLDFAPMVRDFYRRSGIDTKLTGYTLTYFGEGDRMRPSALEMVASLLDYLHTKPILVQPERRKIDNPDPKTKKKVPQITETVMHERKFFIVPDLLAMPETVNFRNIGDEYYAIVPSSTNLVTSEARRAYLQFVLDPLVIKNAKDISPLKEGIKNLLDELKQYLYAKEKERNPAAKIDDVYVSPDIFLAVSRSVVAAAEAREVEYRRVQVATILARRRIDAAQTVDAKKAISAELAALKNELADETVLELSSAYDRGAVLTFYFADQLKGIEESGFDIGSSLKDMILSLDPAKESNRVAQYAEARKRALAARDVRSKRLTEQAKVIITALNEIEGMISGKKFEEADAKLKNLLDTYPTEPRVYYALGRLSSAMAANAFDEGLRDKRLEDAKVHYSNALRVSNAATDPALIQLCYVALGRIYEFNDDADYALRIYQTAVKYGPADQGAYNEASAAIARLTKKP